jgi:hypothetical protein
MSEVLESQRFVARRYQAIASIALLMVLVGTSLLTDLLARNRSLEKSLMSLSSEFAKKTNTVFSNTGNFIDSEDRILLDEIPRTDYSRGGVYFFGSSNMKWAFTTWDLPPEQKRFIGNYGIGATSHTDQLRLIQYLIEQRGFLTAGKQDLVILGASFPLARGKISTGYFESLFRRHGLYTITPDDRIFPVPMSAVERWLRIEKARSGGFFWNLGRLAKGWVWVLAGVHYPPPRGISSFDHYLGFMGGGQWQQNMDAELERLRETIFLLRSHQAQVKVMLLPEATWDNELPYKPPYEAKIRALCQATSTPLIDLSHAMPDEAFVDSIHLTADGQEKFRGLISGEILEHLQNLEKITHPSLVDGKSGP